MKNCTLLACVLFSMVSFGQRGFPPKDVVTATHTTLYAQHVDFLPEMVKLLKVPEGWEVSIAASGLGKPRMLYPSKNGDLYVTRRDGGDVLLLKDTNNDRKFDEIKTVVADFKGVHGITIREGWLYVCNNNELRRYQLNADGTTKPESKKMLFNDMISAGQHPNRTMEFGPNGKLYISIGSLCNDCKEADPEAATIVEVDPSNWTRTIYASGLRNTIGFDWHPQTKELWGMDNGADAKGDDWPPEELNQIKQFGNYAYPFGYGKKEVDKTREDPAGDTKENVVAATEASIMEFQAHSAPTDFKFFDTGAMAGNALIAWHGSWNRSGPVGFKVEMVTFTDGKPTASQDFLTGFLVEGAKARFGRPTGLAIMPDGSVYLSDDANGVIYCVKQKSKN